MFSPLLVNPSTVKQLERYLANPSQALLLEGPAGAGKLYLARAVAAKLLGKDIEKLDNYAFFSVISKPEKKSEIIIDQIRELRSRLTLQVPGEAAVKRVIIIENAELMNTEAQNAFLKSLEEPPAGTIFILTAESSAGLLQTINSRTAAVAIKAVSLAAANDYFKNAQPKEVSAAWALSQGMPGLLVTLLNGEDNELKKAVADAKDFLAKSPYERLLMLDQLKDKAELKLLLDGLARALKALYRAAAQRGDQARTIKLIRSFQEINEAQNSLDVNVLTRLVVLRLVLNLSV